MFNTAALWDQRHKQDAKDKTHVDWYCSYTTLRPLISPLLGKPRSSVLVLGCGISTFPEELYDDGVARDIAVIDFSEEALKAVKARNENKCRSGLKYEQQDLGEGLQLDHPPFDVVVDKGTIDCMLCDLNGYKRAQRAIASLYANMRTPGTLIMVSHSAPPDRLGLFQGLYFHEIKVKVVTTTLPERIHRDGYNEVMTDLEEGSDRGPYQPDTAYVYVLTK